MGTLPVAGSDEQKRTNEIGMAIPLLEGCDLAGKDVTGDALLTQRALATYIVARQAHYYFTAKGNQPALQRDIALLFEKREAADFVELALADHGRIETRRIWCSTALNAYIDFPHVGQVFLIERESIDNKTGGHGHGDLPLEDACSTGLRAEPLLRLNSDLLGNVGIKLGCFCEVFCGGLWGLLGNFQPKLRETSLHLRQLQGS